MYRTRPAGRTRPRGPCGRADNIFVAELLQVQCIGRRPLLIVILTVNMESARIDECIAFAAAETQM